MANIRLGANRSVYASRFGSLLSGVTVLGQVGETPAPYVDISKGNAFPDWNTLMSKWLMSGMQTYLKPAARAIWNWGSSTDSVQTVRKVQLPATFPTQITDYKNFMYPKELYLPSAPAMSLGAHMIKAWGDFLHDGAGKIAEYERAIDIFQRGAEEIKKNFFRDFAGISYGPVVGNIYVTPMLTLLRQKAAELAAQSAALQTSAEETAASAMSYYQVGKTDIEKLQQIASAEQWLFQWNAVQANYQDEENRWVRWYSQLANYPHLRTPVGQARTQFLFELNKAAGMVMQKTEARAKQLTIETGAPVSYADVARTNVLKTGTWSRVELDVQSTSAAQISGAVARMDGYIIQLKPALTAEISKAKALYNQITPMAQAYAEGTSLAVSTDPKFIAKVEEFNNIVLQLEARFGGAPAGGVKWGLILGLGAAAVGAFMLAT